jgi:recombination protein RecT
MTNEIAVYMQKDAVKSHFIELMGNHDGTAYIQSVLLAVANEPKLQQCTPESVYISALRAATLHLSVDPSLGQAYLVPFKNRKTGKDIATFIPGYKGLYDMAIRTGKYRYINVDHLYEGETIEIDRITGYGKLGGGKIGDAITGYFAAFEMLNGFFKIIYMSVEEIEAHAQQYSRNYGYEDSLWKKEHDKMCRKTILRILIRKWGYIDPADASVLSEAEEGQADLVEGEIVESDNGTEPEPKENKPQETIKQAIESLGFDTIPAKSSAMTLEHAKTFTRDSDKKKYSDMTDQELEDAIDGLSSTLSSSVTARTQNRILEKLDAIKLIREERKEKDAVLVD